MPRPIIEQLATATVSDPIKLATQLRTILTDLERQLQSNSYTSSTEGPTESGLKRGDPIFRFKNDVLQVGIFDGRTARFLNASDLQSLQKHNTNFVGKKEGTTAAAAAGTRTTHFPDDGDWGFYNDTNLNTFHLIFNLNNTTQLVAM